jgi:hypothetical protein
MRKSMLLIVLGLAATGCNKGPEVSLTNASPEEVTKAAADSGISDVVLRPGQWEHKVEVTTIDMPGMPAAMVDMMKKRSTTTVSSCMTKEQAQNPNPKTFSQQKDDNCTFRNFTMRQGKLDATMACKGGQGEMVMTMAGTYAPEKMDYQATMESGMPGGKTMKMVTKVSGHRTGDCTEAAGKTAK